MGRKRNIFVREFFKFDVQNNESTCKTCGLKFNGSYVTNLRRHMVTNHLQMYQEEREKIEDERSKQVFEKKCKFFVQLSIEEVKNACVALVTKESQPFSLLDCNAFKVFTEQIFKGLDMPIINSVNIMDYVIEKYENLKTAVKNSCKGQMISLKMDTATRLERSVLGINIQIIKHNKIQIYSLAMKELNGRHTADNLKEELENVLKEFEIKKSQIYCITTDNGRNMLKAVEIFSNENSNESEEDEEEAINSEKFAETLMENVCSEEQNIISVKCAAHTLQLAVKDYLSNTEKDEKIISRARDIVKTLRTPTFR